MGFPSILESFVRQVEDQHLRGKLKNLIQLGISIMSEDEKSKYSGMTFNMSGCPKT
jgi:hypothetical protein